MRISPKSWKILGIGLAIVVVAVLVVRTWVVPGLIVRQLEARYAGKVTVGGWWLGGRSSGITNLALHEGPAADSPVWATARAIETDISLGGLLGGRVMPGRITLRSPALTFRLDADGKPLTRLPLKGGGGGPSALPEIVVEDATVTIDQQGRKPMIVTKVGARLASGTDAERLSAEADDPTWGRWEVQGRFEPGFRAGTIRLSSTGAAADADKVARIPYVPKEVWQHIVPTGTVDVRLDLTLATGEAAPVRVHTEVDLKQTTADLKSLDLVSADTTGTVVIDGGLVRVKNIAGRAVGGRVGASGTLDFTQAAPAFGLAMTLDAINIAEAPRKWQLHEVGMTAGRLTGKADLKAVLRPSGVDLTGTTGAALIEGGTLQGIPIKSLRLAMTAEGDDLRYESGTARAAWLDRALLGLIALQPPPAASEKAEAPRAAEPTGAAPKAKARATVKANEPKPGAGGLQLPKSITTQIELEDVDLKQLVDKAAAMKIHIPVPVAGKLSLKADATIPLGSLRDVKEYIFRGDARLAGASIAGVDLGNLRAKLDLADGVLELSDFRGQLVDLPEGGVGGKRPAPTAPVPAEGPLPAGGFRGHLRAELSPPGRLSASFEGNALPLGELAAPALPRPTPLSGALTFDFEARADVAHIGDPRAWTLSGRARSDRVTYLRTTLDAASTTFTLKEGRLEVPDLAARLGGKPLSAHLGTDLAPPYAFDARLDVADWDLSDLLTLIPGAPRPAPADGLLTARAEAQGTLTPRDIRTNGRGHVARFRVGAVPLGDVPFRWQTEGDAIVAHVDDARPFGGRLSAEARVPARGEGPSRGTVRATGIDTAPMAAQLVGAALKLTGKADGQLDFLIPAHVAEGAPAVEANLTLSAPDLTVQGVPAEGVAASVWARTGVVHYEVTAASLGGKVKLKGDVPLAPVPADPGPGAAAGAGARTGARPRPLANGEIRASGFELGALWKGLGLGSALAPLTGVGALNANVRAAIDRPAVYARALAEARDLRWGRFPLGHLKATLALTPASWRIDPLGGELLGGVARGSAWGDTPRAGPHRSGFDLTVEGADLATALAFVPHLARHATGAGTLRLAGRMDDGLHATGEIDVARARVYGLPLTELRVPAALSTAPGTSSGSIEVRHWSARLAGGRLDGDARFHFGEDRAFDGMLHLGSVDLEILTRIGTEMRRPASGRVTGKITWAGRDPTRLRGLRGKVDLDLDDASLFELPVFKELSRFLGAAQRGIFEDGDLHATLGERQLTVDQFTLEGRLAQLHVAGTVGYDTQLNLEVLVNTNQLIPETGQALARLIPGLSEVAGRREQAVPRVGNYLSNRLLKFRVTGTLRSPQVNLDPAIAVGETAVGFFGSVLKLPLGFLR